MDGVYEAFLLSDIGRPFHPIRTSTGWITMCNEAFNLVAMRMGFDAFARPSSQRPYGAILANHMFDEMEKESGSWRRVTSATGAQDLANLGALVAAACKNETGH